MKIEPLSGSKLAVYIGFPVKQDFDLARAAQLDGAIQALRQVIRELKGRCSKSNWIVYELQSALSEIEKEVSNG